MNSISWICTNDNYTIFFEGRPYTIPLTDHRTDRLTEALRNDDVGALRELLKFKQTVANVSEGRIAFDGRTLTFNDQPLHNAILDRLVTLFENELPISGHLQFLDRLMNNPSFRAVNETYRFIEACDLPITSDGYFLAYKIVRKDYKDLYTGTFDNSVGQTPTIDRNLVDEDANRTCSHGLHICSKEYLPHYGGFYGGSGGDSRIMVVKVDPANVVAVPIDYNNAKMRVCEYEVVSEIPFDEVFGALDSYHTDSHGSVPYIDEPDEIWLEDEDDSEDYWDEFWDDFDDDFDDDDKDDSDDDWDTVAEDDVSEPEPEPAPEPVVKAKAKAKVTLKLNAHQVQDILRLLNDGEMTLVAIGNIYDVNESTIRKIRDGLIHSDITGR